VLQPKVDAMTTVDDLHLLKVSRPLRWTKVVSGSLHFKKTFESKKTRDVSHHGLAIYIKKYLKAKEEL
jgi:hypothetical protein